MAVEPTGPMTGQRTVLPSSFPAQKPPSARFQTEVRYQLNAFHKLSRSIRTTIEPSAIMLQTRSDVFASPGHHHKVDPRSLADDDPCRRSEIDCLSYLRRILGSQRSLKASKSKPISRVTSSFGEGVDQCTDDVSGHLASPPKHHSSAGGEGESKSAANELLTIFGQLFRDTCTTSEILPASQFEYHIDAYIERGLQAACCSALILMMPFSWKQPAC